jgi:hypothetical protein
LFSSSGWRLRPLEYAHRWSPCGIVQKDRPVARQRQNGLPLARALQPLAQLGQKSPKAGIVRGPPISASAGSADEAGLQRGASP